MKLSALLMERHHLDAQMEAAAAALQSTPLSADFHNFVKMYMIRY